jgi:hypothetical protein
MRKTKPTKKASAAPAPAPSLAHTITGHIDAALDAVAKIRWQLEEIRIAVDLSLGRYPRFLFEWTGEILIARLSRDECGKLLVPDGKRVLDLAGAARITKKSECELAALWCATWAQTVGDAEVADLRRRAGLATR